MARCQSCGCRYGLLGLDRTALFEKCPNGCDDSEEDRERRIEERARKTKEIVKELESDGYCYKCETYHPCSHKRGY